MDMKYRKGLALLLAVMMIASSAVMLAACGSSGGNGGSGSGSESSESGSGGSAGSESGEAGENGEDFDEDDGERASEIIAKGEYNTTTAFVTDKCYALTGMAYGPAN